MISEENLLKASVLGYMPDEVFRDAGADPVLMESLKDDPGNLDEALGPFLEGSSVEAVGWLLHRLMSGSEGLKNALLRSKAASEWIKENQDAVHEAIANKKWESPTGD